MARQKKLLRTETQEKAEEVVVHLEEKVQETKNLQEEELKKHIAGLIQQMDSKIQDEAADKNE